MHLSVLQCYLALSMTIFLGLFTVSNSERKARQSFKLCGQEFLDYYKALCSGKTEDIRGRRSISNVPVNEVSKQRSQLPVMNEKIAKQFLRRMKRFPRSVSDNAHEECCLETCTLEEVREYPCQ